MSVPVNISCGLLMMDIWLRPVILLVWLTCSMRGQTTVTFQIDMKTPLEQGVFDPHACDSVDVRGSFNGWSGCDFLLETRAGNAVYETTRELPAAPGDTVEFKFVIRHHQVGDIWEESPDSSTGEHGNRRLVLTGEPVTIPLSSFDLPPYPIDNSTKFSVRELQEDFQRLRSAMEENGRILYAYTDKATFDQLFDRQYSEITRPMAADEFRRVIAPLIARVGCGHTSLWQPPGYWRRFRGRLMPVKLVFLKGKCYVQKSYGDAKGIPEGSEIVSINGKSASHVLEVLKANSSADAYNESFRMYKINEGCSFRYGLDFGYPDTFRFIYHPPEGGGQRTVTLSAVDLETVEHDRIEKNTTERNVLDRTLTSDGTGEGSTLALGIRSFAFYENPERFTGFIDSVFGVIHEKEIRNLILDIRHNDGGNPFCSAHLFSYLEPRPLPYFAEEYGKYASLAHPIPVADKPFRGKLITLINGGCFSTTPHFCALLKYHGIGTLVGTQTGGTYSCNAATNTVRLPNTRFIVLVSRRSFAAAVEGFSLMRGIDPDLQVEPNIEDLLRRRDAPMEHALRLARGEGKKN